MAEPSLSCGMWDLVSGTGIEPGPLALGVQSLNHWTTKEILRWQILHYGCTLETNTFFKNIFCLENRAMGWI